MNEIEELTRCVNGLQDKSIKRGLNDFECHKFRIALIKLMEYKTCIEKEDKNKENNPKVRVNVLV